jgi:hypothetical protein
LSVGIPRENGWATSLFDRIDIITDLLFPIRQDSPSAAKISHRCLDLGLRLRLLLGHAGTNLIHDLDDD